MGLRLVLAALGVCFVLPGAARAARPPLQSDIDRCTLKAEDAGRGHLNGSLRLQLLARASGKVYAGFVAAESGAGDRLLERCILYTAMLWELPPAKLDYEWPYPIAFTPGVADHSLDARDDPQRQVYDNGSGQGRASVFAGDLDHPGIAGPIDVAAAQATLEVADDASPAERAFAELSVKRHAKAEAGFRAVLREDPKNALALRGLAQTLAETGGDLREGRTVATRLVALAPGSEQGHEAMLRVCLAAGDDLCAFESFRRANGASDLSLRWLVLRDELLEPARAAADRLQRRARGEAPPAPAPALADAARPVSMAPAPAPILRAQRFEVALRAGLWASVADTPPSGGTGINATPVRSSKGNLVSGTDFSVANSFPVALEVGTRLERHLQMGAYFQYASTASRLCPSETGCSGHDLHGGATAQFHPAPEATFDPWLGLSVGYGSRRISQKSPQWGDVTGDFSGPEMGIETGLAFRMTSAVRFGPFASFGLSRYRGSATATPGTRGGEDASASVSRGWSGSALLGVRIGYGFPD